MVWTDIAFILFSKISLGLNYFPLTYTSQRNWLKSQQFFKISLIFLILSFTCPNDKPIFLEICLYV